MNRMDFEQLRDLPNKEVVEDIIFTRRNATTLAFQDVRVNNSMGLDLILNGSYKPDIPAVKYNFAVLGVGPICRVEVNGQIHKTEGRTHKHDLQKESCPRNNLPFAKARPDLEHLTAKQVWEKVCAMANIRHTGRFEEPKE